MQAFDDVLFPLALGREARVATSFSTRVFTAVSGHETRNTDWADAQMRYDVGPGLRSAQDAQALARFFRARRGAARGFRFLDPFDSQSADAVTALDQPLGTGDGVATGFALMKYYGEGEDAQARRITRPVAGSVRVAVDGVESAAFILGGAGMVHFADPPPPGAVLTAGFAFHVPVRFEQDRLDLQAVAPNGADIASVPLIEIREA